MIRVKFIKDYKDHKKDEIGLFSNNEAFGFIDKGVAIISKDITSQDYTSSNYSPGNKRKYKVREK